MIHTQFLLSFLGTNILNFWIKIYLKRIDDFIQKTKTLSSSWLELVKQSEKTIKKMVV